jgi:polyketide cyclase/dehydrase/lipid transport protein
MAAFQNIITIARPADEVFAFLADFGTIPAWNYAIECTVQTSPGQAGVGRLAINGQIGPFNTITSYLLEPTADGTRLTNDVDLEPSSALLRPLGPLTVPEVKAAVARNLGTLKQLLEGTGPTSEADQR